MTNTQLDITVEPMRVWRARRSFSRAELARRAGVARQTVENVEAGRHRPTRAVRRVLAETLGVEPEQVLELAPKT